ncbi:MULTISPECIES: PLP-dependent cysteine synthase family protein [unclassified Chelatococcus]|uniref:PLP-dependent cysteine synthase family protein n=1 Tax=unclassified Chelatococcus TaxID=2638111 RepID=UPI0002FB1D18|nr:MULTISPECIES: PLP-dependent cysteine synthase family protein [unclassified Chelatococcus]ALA18516.1 pyridoxal-5-phosphate-dependent protein subunit beta [Chelatococcus sp. CO-6]
MSARWRHSYLDGYATPRLAKLAPNLVAACFPLMKLLPARFMLNRAEARGELMPGGHIVETTSGTFGLALALLAAVRGYRLSLVSADTLLDASLQRRLAALGARIEIVPDADKTGAQRARLARLEAIRSGHPEAWWPQQYDNPDNPRAYARLAELLVRTLGAVDCLVGPVGSGGSICGTSAFLREVFPAMRTVAVDTHRSVLFGHAAGSRLLRGLGNSLVPQNVDHSAFDEVHWVGGLQAFAATRRLHREHGFFAGPTSGAAILVASWHARRHPDQLTVVILPDEGHRYQDTVHNDDWLSALPGWPAAEAAGPLELQHLAPLGEATWTCIAWQRRSLDAARRDFGDGLAPDALT